MGRSPRSSLGLLCLGLPLAVALGCGERDGRFAYTAAEEPGLCLAVRGNGEKILSSLYSLARLNELYGPFDAIAGSSSGSGVAFLYESMVLNPAIRDCGDRSCDAREQGRRLALALKSLEGLIEAQARTNEVRALVGMGSWLARVREEGFRASDVGGVVVNTARLLFVLASPDVIGLVNRDVVADLLNPWRTRGAFEEIRNAVQGDAFGAESSAVLFRRNVLSLEQLVEFVGRSGDFYAGYGATSPEAWRAFYEDCAARAVGRTWRDFAYEDFEARGRVASCDARFEALLPGWLARLTAGFRLHERLDEEVGAGIHSIVSSSVILGETREQALAAKRAFSAGEPPDFQPRFADVRVGYWGQPERIERLVRETPARFRDRKSQMMLGLGATSWRRAMEHSMTEPGLGPILDLGDGAPRAASAGGWLDNHAVMAVWGAGCRTVIYLSRRGPDSAFGRRVAELLGASAEERREIFEVGYAGSSISVALREASGVWCTDWNAHGLGDLQALVEDAYSAPFQMNDPTLFEAARDHPAASTATGLPGCQYRVPVPPSANPE